MSAYVLFFREKVLDQSELDKYWSLTQSAMDGHTAKLLSAYDRQEVFEGAPPDGVVILEFSSMQSAKAWYESPQYQAASEHRKKGALWRVVLVDGHEGDFKKPGSHLPAPSVTEPHL